MKRRGVFSLFISIWVIGGILGFGLGPGQVAYATDLACVVMNTDGSVSITRGNTGVRSSVTEGTKVYEADQMFLTYGSRVGLAFDQDALDVMHFDGPCTLTFRTPTRVEMSNGQAVVVLDNRRFHRSFRIQTPSAVASATGAHFKVKIDNDKSEVHSYKSQVTVYGRQEDGSELPAPVIIDAGQKTSVRSLGKSPLPPQPMTKQDLIEMDVVRGLSLRAAHWAKQKASQWFAEQLEKPQPEVPQQPSAPVQVPQSRSDKDGTHYLF